MPYIALFYHSRGLSPIEIGIIELSYTLTGSLSRPIFGSIADKTRRHRLVLGISLLVFSLIFFAITFVKPSHDPEVRYPVYLSCNTSTHDFKVG